jgi:hypothetical protein
MTIPKAPAEWETTALVDEHGDLVPPHASTRLRPPASAWVEGGRLFYTEAEDTSKATTPSRRMLEEFMGLGQDAVGTKILRFAQRWGVLGICPHDFSLMFHLRCTARRARAKLPSAAPGLAYWEPLETWRRIAALVRALMNMASRLERGELVHAADAALLDPGVRRLFEREITLEQQRKLFALEVSTWLMGAGTRPCLSWEKARCVGALAYDGVLGAIGAQLYATLGRPLVPCSGCGAWIRPDRMSSSGGATWCEKCRGGEREAAIARAYRIRKETARKLKREGVSVDEIAARLGRPAKTIRGWVRPSHGK